MEKNRKKEENIIIRKREGVYKVRKENIIFIESFNRNLILHTIHGIYEMSRYALKNINKQLSNNFVRCHNSYIVNNEFVKDINQKKKSIIVNENSKMIEIPIGRVYKQNVLLEVKCE